jgi:D-xylose transport system ATP-binding protein
MSSAVLAQPPATSAAPWLLARGIRKSFGGVHALRGVDFEVRAGEVMALVGDNGAGKSTLVKILCGSQQADAGDFQIDGKVVQLRTPHDAALHGIAIVYQDLAQCRNLDVVANLFLGQEMTSRNALWQWLPAALRPLDSIEMENRSVKALERLRVRTLRSFRTEIGSLSGGQRQAVAIARATLGNASMVLLDEPTAALGIAQTAQVLDVVTQLRGNGHAVVLISHNLDDVFVVADRITVLRLGRRVALFERTEEGFRRDAVIAAITSGGSRDDE